MNTKELEKYYAIKTADRMTRRNAPACFCDDPQDVFDLAPTKTKIPIIPFGDPSGGEPIPDIVVNPIQDILVPDNKNTGVVPPDLITDVRNRTGGNNNISPTTTGPTTNNVVETPENVKMLDEEPKKNRNWLLVLLAIGGAYVLFSNKEEKPKKKGLSAAKKVTI